MATPLVQAQNMNLRFH